MKNLLVVIALVCMCLIGFSGTALGGQKNRIEITDCVCDGQEDGSFDCTIDFEGAAPLGDIDYHAHVTTELDGVLASDNGIPLSCKEQTECSGIAGADPYVATCGGAGMPSTDCTDLLETDPEADFSIVAKVAGDADDEAMHGKAKRALKDNYPHCTINPYVAP